MGSMRCCSESPITQNSPKKHAPDKSLFTWLTNDDTDSTTLPPSQELMWKLVQNHVLDLKTSKCMVLSSKHILEFPNSEWINMLAGKVVNLDAIFSGMYSTIMDNRAIENIGDLELHFGAAKPAKAVKTHGDWVIAWRIAFKATRFIFPHHKSKLEEYNDYVTSYFMSIYPSAHWKVLNLDKAIWKQAGSVNNVSLNEFGKFRYLETRHLQGHGTGESSAPTKDRLAHKDGSGLSLNWRKTDPCHLWNDGKCSHQALSCKFWHICELCQKIRKSHIRQYNAI
jgi:hypothetical protein